MGNERLLSPVRGKLVTSWVLRGTSETPLCLLKALLGALSGVCWSHEQTVALIKAAGFSAKPIKKSERKGARVLLWRVDG